MSPAETFVKALSTFERQVGEATQFWFAAATVNEMAILDAHVSAAFQIAPLFWRTVRGGLEHQAIVAIGRVFGQRSANPVNIDSLLQTIRESIDSALSRDAIKARKATLGLTKRQLAIW